MESDVKQVTSCAYEALKDISRNAVALGDDATAIRVTEAYAALGIHTANLNARAFREHTAPLTHDPISYALVCIKYAQTKDLYEVPFQGAARLSRVALVAPKDVRPSDMHAAIVEGLFHIAAYFYGKREGALAEEVNGQQMKILAHLLGRQDFFFQEIFESVLEKFKALAPLSLATEQRTGSWPNTPLTKVYGLTHQNSIGYLFAAAADVSSGGATDWTSRPAAQATAMLETIRHHLRRLAEKNELVDSQLLVDIDGMIKHIAEVILSLFEMPSSLSKEDKKALVQQLTWMLSFYPVVFNRKENLDARMADECCDSLAFVGLAFFARDYPDVLGVCLAHIRSIIESYCDSGQQPKFFTIGDLFAHLRAVRMLMVARNEQKLVEEVDEKLNTKPSGLTEEQWQSAAREIGLGRQQLEKRIKHTAGASWHESEGTEGILRQLLRETKAQRPCR